MYIWLFGTYYHFDNGSYLMFNKEIFRENVLKSSFPELQCFSLCFYYASICILRLCIFWINKWLTDVEKCDNSYFIIEKVLAYFCCILLGSEMENSASTTNECLLIQCPRNDIKFIVNNCHRVNSQICNKTRKLYFKFNTYLYFVFLCLIFVKK